MCRLVAYLGEPVLMEDVLVKPKNSIILQSLHARETDIRTNGDGFGLGWYAPTISTEPGLFTSVSPAWNDRNLLSLTSKIESPCFFAHIRAASAGGVTQYNCHPFVNGKWMLMHNGGVQDFIQVKRHLRHLLADDIYHWIQGETDSEHIFALFLQLSKGKNLDNTQTLVDVVRKTIRTVEELVKEYGTPGPSYFNLCLTDGHRLLATHYCSSKQHKPVSFHYLTESTFIRNAQRPGMRDLREDAHFVLVASERLTAFNTEWNEIPANHLIVSDHHNIEIEPVFK